MTDEKAIEVIQQNCYVSNLLDLDETVMINTALDLAVDVLKQNQWVKYDDDDSRTWPEDGGWYIWQHKRGGMKIFRWKQDAQNHFYPDPYMWDTKDMIAWRPLPDPYKEVDG